MHLSLTCIKESPAVFNAQETISSVMSSESLAVGESLYWFIFKWPSKAGPITMLSGKGAG